MNEFLIFYQLSYIELGELQLSFSFEAKHITLYDINTPAPNFIAK